MRNIPRYALFCCKSRVLSHHSGGTASAVKKALEFLGAIEADGTSTQVLRDLVNAYETLEWESVFSEVITRSYASVIDGVDLVNGTSRQLEEAFGKAGVKGETKRKAIKFYLDALDSAGIKRSKHFKPPKSAPRNRDTSAQPEEENSETRVSDQNGDAPTQDNGAPKEESPTTGSGGFSVPEGYFELTVQVPFRVHPYKIILPNDTNLDDWGFVRDYVDSWHDYNEKKKQQPNKNAESE